MASVFAVHVVQLPPIKYEVAKEMAVQVASLVPAATQVLEFAENLGKLPLLTFAQSLSLVTTMHAVVVASQIGAICAPEQYGLLLPNP